jgi:hypothetical protein
MLILDLPRSPAYNLRRVGGHGSVVERLLPKQNVAGSNPAARSQ